MNRSYFKLLPICLWPNDNQPEMYSTVFFKLVVQGLREIGVSYCVHNVTTAVLPIVQSQWRHSPVVILCTQ